MTRYNVGVIGCGFFGSALARELEAHPRFALTMLCDRDERRLSGLASELGTTVTNDHDDVCSHPGLDLVVVATPNHVHTEAASAALGRGKAVFVEKPLAVDLDEAQRMIELATDSGVPLMVGHIMRMMPGVRRVADLVFSGEIGTVAAIDTSRARWIDTDDADPQWWKLDKDRAGGELTHEIHELDLLCWLGGEVSAVSSIATPDDGIRDTLVEFTNGAIGRHTIATRSHIAAWALTVTGSTGAVHADFHTGRVTLVRRGTVEKSWHVFDGAAENDSLIDSARRTQKYNSGSGGTSVWMQAAIRHEIDEMAAVLDGKPVDDSPLTQARARALVVAEQVRRGHAQPIASGIAR